MGWVILLKPNALPKLMLIFIGVVLLMANWPIMAAISTSQAQALAIKDRSSSKRPIAGAILTISGIPETFVTGADGSIELLLVPAGSMDIVARWKSAYNPEPVTIATSSIILDRTLDMTIVATVYDAELQLVSPSGKPIVNAEVWLAGVSLGMTGADGKVLAMQVPSWYSSTHRPYPVTATWLDEDVGPGEVDITATRTYVLMAKNIASLTVQVVDAQGQGLNAAQVEIKTFKGIMVFSGVSDEQGFVSIEVPYGTYDVDVDYKGFTNAASATVGSPIGTIMSVPTNVFIEVLGMAMSFATFTLWLVAMIIVILVMAIAMHEYHIYRRKRLPQLFGTPRAPGS
jgi:hypothetical protein